MLFNECVLTQLVKRQHLAFNYLISGLWDGDIRNDEYEDLDNFTQIYIDHHKQIYPITDQTSNLHSVNHFVETFEFRAI